MAWQTETKLDPSGIRMIYAFEDDNPEHKYLDWSYNIDR